MRSVSQLSSPQEIPFWKRIKLTCTDLWADGQCQSNPAHLLPSTKLILLRLYYLLKYPPTASGPALASAAKKSDQTPPPLGQGIGYADAERNSEAEKARPNVAGAFVLCPMVQGMSGISEVRIMLICTVSANSRPYGITEFIGRGIKYFAGALPLAQAVRGMSMFS
jgi:hypothetical protein